MPLIRSASKEAFKENFKTETDAGKPMKNSLAIAYAMKKRKMAKGGMVEENEKLHPEHEPMDQGRAASIVHAIMASKKGYAHGGMVEEDEHDSSEDQAEESSHADDTFLTGEHDVDDSPDGMEMSEIGGDEDEDKEKNMMSRIMGQLRSRGMGR